MTRAITLLVPAVVLPCLWLAACGGTDVTSVGGSSNGAISSTNSVTSPGGTTSSTYSVAGTVSGTAAATLTLSGTAAATTATDSSGAYSFASLADGGYTLTPSETGYVFSPVSLGATVNGASLTALNFAATPNTAPTYTLSGTVSGAVAAGVTITLNGVNIGAAVTDMSGNYSFSGLVGGTYTVSASLSGYSFSKPLIVTFGTDDSALNNFTATVSPSGSDLAFTVVSPLPQATIGLPYANTVVKSISGGTGPYQYQTDVLASGTPPLGMILNPNGDLTGTASLAGTYTFGVCATDSAGDRSSTCATVSLTVVAAAAPPPAAAPTVTLTATPTTLLSGNTATLAWSSTNATSCTAGDGWTGTQGTSGTLSESPTTTTTYTLACSGAGGSASESVTITVDSATAEPAPTVIFTASPATITSGSKSTLTWSTTDATSCTAGDAWTGTQGTSGSVSKSPTSTATYTLSCSGPGGTASATATITVNAAAPTPTPAPTVTLTANPTAITSGSSSTLTWSSTNATTCTASGGWSGTRATSGTASESPTATTTYSLACTGAGGSKSASASVTVNAAVSAPSSSTSWVYFGGLFDWPGSYSYDVALNYLDTTGNPLSGLFDLKVTTTSPYGGWQPYAQNWSFNAAPYTYLVFALKPTVPNQSWQVYFMNVGDKPVTGANGQQIVINPADYGPAPVVGEWSTYTIPLSALGVAGKSIYKFCIQDETGLNNNSWYVDNVGFAP